MKTYPYNVLARRPAFSPADMAGGVLERKDDSGTRKDDGKDLDTKTALRDFMSSWEEYKAANDERLAGLEKKQTDPLAEEKLRKIDGFLDKYEGLNQKITDAERRADEIKRMNDRFDEIETILQRANAGGTGGDSREEKMVQAAEWARGVVMRTLYGTDGMTENQTKALAAAVDQFKALNVSTNTEGGYLAPVELIREITKTVTEISPVRSLARVRTTGMRAVEIPKRTGTFAAQWVSEQGTKAETTGLSYGVDEITTHEFYALIDITNQMLEDSMFDIVDEVRMESTEQFALAEGAAFVNGNGIGKPEGFLQHAAIAETVSGTATTIADANGQANGIIDLKYGLKTAYTRNATFLMNRTTMASVRKLKDGQNNYIWMPGIAQGRPNTIDGDPYVEMPDMPSEGAGAFPIAYGDFRRGYTWVDRIQMEMLRDPFTQATGGKTRFIMRKRVGGRVHIAEAIRKLKCATS